jgi:hypothetical protein
VVRDASRCLEGKVAATSLSPENSGIDTLTVASVPAERVKNFGKVLVRLVTEV